MTIVASVDRESLGKADRDLGLWVAYGVAPCDAEGHTLRTRNGHCLQCQGDGLGPNPYRANHAD